MGRLTVQWVMNVKTTCNSAKEPVCVYVCECAAAAAAAAAAGQPH